MRYHPPFDPCDEPLCLTLAEHEIVQERVGKDSRTAALACQWHVQSLWRDIVAKHVEKGYDPDHVTGFYVQRYIPR